MTTLPGDPGACPDTRAGRKQWRRDLAAAMRTAGVVPTGAAWTLAVDTGERDPDTLRRANATDGVAAKRLPDGAPLPGGVRDGDHLPDIGGGVVVVGDPVSDPDTGAVWVVGRHPDGTTADHELTPGTPVRVTRHRTAPGWVMAAAADYRDARDGWEAARESCTILAPSTVPGTAGADIVMAQLPPATYAEHVPAPRFADYLRDHAARMRQPDA